MQLICSNCGKTFERKRIRPAENRFCSPDCQRTFHGKNVKKNKCRTCGKKTPNPKFCSSSCAAIYNNTKFPKRTVEGKCLECDTLIPAKRRYCDDCLEQHHKVDYNKVTLADFKERRTSQPHVRIRQLARAAYIKANRPQECEICSYSTFFHVCHVIGIKDFDPNTPMSIVNAPSNLVALCPNHHAEFDAGLITL